MSKQEGIRFLYDKAAGMELIICRQSTLSYPLHNHVSVCTIGMVLEGSILLTRNSSPHSYKQFDTFLIPPYMPHSIEAQGPYTLLSLCIHKDRLASFGKGQPENTASFMDGLRTQLELVPEIPFSIDEMAHSACISKYHFIRSFRREVGLTPHQFQMQNRIRKAQRLLNEADTIAEVALATGFCDQSHFIKQFKKVVGMTPTVYKESCDVISLSFR